MNKHLTIQYSKLLIVESGKCDIFGDIPLESAPFAKWFAISNDEFRKQFQAWLEDNKLSFTISNCTLPLKDHDKQETAVEGLYYRIPAQCKLEITKDALVATSYIEIMQCGRLAVVEITN